MEFSRHHCLKLYSTWRVALVGVVGCILMVFLYSRWILSGGYYQPHPDQVSGEALTIQTERRKMINRICDQNEIHPKLDDTSKFRHIIVNEKHKLLYCHIPKVACTNWKRVMLVLSEQLNVTDPLEITAQQAHSQQYSQFLKTLDTFPIEQIKTMLDSYTKFMFVREPMERLLSAYRNKFTKKYNKYFHERYGRKIIQKYRANATTVSKQLGNDVSFSEFIAFVLDTREPFNDHWQFYYKLCCPCIVHYDIIGKYETLAEDAKLVLHTSSVDHLVSFPGSRYPGPPTSDLMKAAFRDISDQNFQKLWRIYSVDYAMFGYSYPGTH